MGWLLWKSCDQLDPDELDAHQEMISAGIDITRETFRRVIGPAELNAWAADHGYDRPGSRQGLTLAKDWHVNYTRSSWNGEPCYFITWSAFEFIWKRQAEASS